MNEVKNQIKIQALSQKKAEQVAEDSSQEKALVCAKAALNKNAENVKIIQLTNLSSISDYFVICSGMSDRQTKAIADSVQKEMKENGHSILSSEGYTEGRWVLIDAGDVIVHVFLDALRDYYHLEGLWADAPRIKIPAEFYTPSF